MRGPAEAVFHGTLAGPMAREMAAWFGIAIGGAAEESLRDLPEPIDCATACTQGCQRPDACPSAEARAQVAALLEGRSLDDLVRLANDSLESRLLGRIPGGGSGV